MKHTLLIKTSKRSIEQLTRLQQLPMNQKINLTLRRISQFYEELDGKVYVAFSGGKDSTVLLNLVRSLYPQVPAVFCDTGLEFPEIRDFVKTVNNTIWLKPKMSFVEVLNHYGYPVISKEIAQILYEIKRWEENGDKKLIKNYIRRNKQLPEKWRFMKKAPFPCSHMCCTVMKKNPSEMFEKEFNLSGYIGTLAEESDLRKTNWIKFGCNSFETKRKKSTPLSFWLEKDIWDYLRQNNIKYSSIYDKGWSRTGCIFCAFGISMEKEDRFLRLHKTHPGLYKYVMEKLGMRRVLNYIRQNKFDLYP